jgi:hypothetical protein
VQHASAHRLQGSGATQNADAITMSTHHLGTYLNDHLAGSVAALELLTHVVEKHADLVDVQTVLSIKHDIEADRETLEALMARFGIDHKHPRKVMGWLADRVTRLKLAIDDPADHTFRAFEMIELVSVGIAGKNGLWRSLSALGGTHPALAELDYPALLARGRDQHARLETLHAALARAALTPSNAT